MIGGLLPGKTFGFVQQKPSDNKTLCPTLDKMVKKIIDNPAKRLLAILHECKAIPASEVCRKAWQKVLNTGDERQLLSRIAKVLELADDVTDVIEELFPRHLNAIQSLRIQLSAGITQQNLNGQWSAFLGNIPDNSIVALEFASSLLDEREELKEIAADTLTEQRDALFSLRSEIVAAADIPDQVKLTILRYIQRLIDSIDEYFITGVFPVLDAANTAVGNIAFDKAYNAALEQTEPGRKFAASLSNVANSVTIATGILQLVEPVSHVFKLLARS
ncbi:hypothetical protein G2912_14060 [Paraburkholderia aspalathi]|uniref:Uncharacterized protein n=1 Tax=Paraburkholderia nemoris TaxID=2793076 RepID=A0ABN7LNW3_9BURK|nr:MULTISPECIES: hypothetical protein [Paraburkholderia]MBK3811478.1 hypothetical protein [Paraburkholderia aspalathi]CAE6761227.1 hypothetical protein R69776_03382 [Paraburkholderia nemoris]